MFITVEGVRYSVNIPGPDPFAIMGEWVIGITPWAPKRLYSRIRAEWAKHRHYQKEEREWIVQGSNGVEHQVLKIGDKFVCDCWPFRRTGDCKHIAAVLEECLV